MRVSLRLCVVAASMISGAAGCLGGPDAEWGAAGIEAPGPAYAVRIDSNITVQHTGPQGPLEPPKQIHTTVRGLLRTEAMDAAGNVPASFRLCHLDLPPAGGRQLVLRDDVWARLPESRLSFQPGSAPASWNLSPWAILMGWRGLTDPVNEVLPTDPNDPRVDPVEDDQPGVRIGIQVDNWGDPQIDASVRVRLPRGTAALAPDGRLVGEVDLAHEVWVWYANMPFPISDRGAAEANEYMRKKLLEWPILSQRHDLSGVPIDPAADCARVLATY